MTIRPGGMSKKEVEARKLFTADPEPLGRHGLPRLEAYHRRILHSEELRGPSVWWGKEVQFPGKKSMERLSSCFLYGVVHLSTANAAELWVYHAIVHPSPRHPGKGPSKVLYPTQREMVVHEQGTSC